MDESDWDDFDPEAPSEREIGREMVDPSAGLGPVLAHFYRGEMDRATTWRERLDRTTYWAVTVLVGILTYAFAGGNRSYVILLGIGALTLFLVVESRRYRDYDVYRARLRLLQENLFANALDPSAGVEHDDWRVKLSEDLRKPAVKISMREALGRRLKRVYLPLYLILLVAWVFHLLLFEPGILGLATGGLTRIPLTLVFALVVAFYVFLFGIAFWPRERNATGDFRDHDFGAWK